MRYLYDLYDDICDIIISRWRLAQRRPTIPLEDLLKDYSMDEGKR